MATPQCLNRPPNLIFNRQIPEPIIEPIIPNLQPLLTSQLRNLQPLLNSPTIITDCSPSICKTLTDIIQLMSVASLVKEKNGGPDIALQLAQPFLRELMLSGALSNPLLTNPISPNFVSPDLINPSFIPPCTNPVFSNGISTNFVNPNVISPILSNFVGSPNLISNLPISRTMGTLL